MHISTRSSQRSGIHSFDIDNYLNPFVPGSRLHHLPISLAHFFGHRPPDQKSKHGVSMLNQPSNLYVWIFAFVGGFIGISIIENVYLALPNLNNHQVPLIIASFGAAAILEYNTIDSPLAQPRNLVFGHLIATIIGVGITKLFLLLPPNRFEELRWLAGALSVGTASAAMAITKTVHPPAGATALLAATNDQITDLGWWLLALIVLGSLLMLASALLVNNVYRCFPLYWWTPVDLVELHKSRHENQGDSFMTASDNEKGARRRSSALKDTTSISAPQIHKPNNNRELEGYQTSIQTTSDLTVTNTRDEPVVFEPRNESDSLYTFTPSSSSVTSIQINADNIIIPDSIELSTWEKRVLEDIRFRLVECKLVEGRANIKS